MPRSGLVQRTHMLQRQWVIMAPSICLMSKMHLPLSEFDHLGHSHTQEGGCPAPGHPLWLMWPFPPLP